MTRIKKAARKLSRSQLAKKQTAHFKRKKALRSLRNLIPRGMAYFNDKAFACTSLDITMY